MADDVLGAAGDFDLQLYGLSAVVYVERGGEILLLRRGVGVLSYRGPAGEGDVVLSEEHSAARWVDPVDMRATMTDAALAALAGGHEWVVTTLRNIRTDLDRYLLRIGRS